MSLLRSYLSLSGCVSAAPCWCYVPCSTSYLFGAKRPRTVGLSVVLCLSQYCQQSLCFITARYTIQTDLADGFGYVNLSIRHRLGILCVYACMCAATFEYNYVRKRPSAALTLHPSFVVCVSVCLCVSLALCVPVSLSPCLFGVLVLSVSVYSFFFFCICLYLVCVSCFLVPSRSLGFVLPSMSCLSVSLSVCRTDIIFSCKWGTIQPL